MHNETISDTDFEWLRTLYGTLETIVLPTKTLGESTLKEMRGALIADIFTSEGGNPLYEAIGHPALMVLMVNDVNGARVVIGPVFTHYEFYKTDEILSTDSSARYTDEDRQDQLEQEKPLAEWEKINGNGRVVSDRTNQGLSIVSKQLRQ
jgi:hypothetical protein